MSTFKKLLALTLALAMVLSVSAFAGSYKADTYKDAAGIDEDCEDAIELMYALDIMKGDANGNFNPTATITRAEIAKMIYVILNYGKDDKAVNYTGAKIFSDVVAGTWYEGYVNYCGATKLVQGRGNGTFGPNDPVTCAEAAKMLLTAIGYSASDRGYTGANWDKNVLSDAAIIGLLDGYKYNTNTYAPRQWVAVMFQNALLDALTYGKMAPVITGGLLTSVSGGYDVVTMGRKYYSLNDYTGYLYATDGAYIDRALIDDKDTTTEADDVYTTYAEDDCVIFAKKATDWIEVDNSGLGYMDLGQQYRVIYKDNGTVYSVRATGKSNVDESILMDIEVDNTYATSSNDANNKYIFTIGDMEAKFNSSSIKALVVDNKTNTQNAKAYKPTDLKAVAGDKKADLYRAVDKDGDGDIDYMIVVEYTYAAVNKVGEHKNYGTYFTAVDVNGSTYKPVGFTAGNNDKWYLDDVVNTEDEIEEGNYIKVNYNPDNGAYDVEVLPVAEAVTYDKRTTKGVHTLGGEDYVVGDNGFEAVANEKVLVSANLKEEMDVVYDGTLVIYAELCDSDYTDLADINAQLVMVTDAYYDVYAGSSYNRYYIDYMTIDGEMHEEVRFIDTKTNAAQFEDVVAALGRNERLFALRESGSNVYLIRLTADNAKDVLDYSSSLLSGYREETATLDTEDNEFGNNYVESENSFFVAYKDEDRNLCFDVMTIDDMGEGKDNAAFIQGLYKTKRTFDTYLAGYFYLPSLELNQATGYLYTTTGNAYDVDDDEWYLEDVVFADGAADEPIQVSKVNGTQISENNEVEANRLYAYTYKKVQGEKVYNLTLIDETSEDGSAGNRCDVQYTDTSFNAGDRKYEITNVYVADNGDEIVVADHSTGREKLTMASSYDIVLKKVVLDRDQTQADKNNDDLYFSVDTEISFVDFETLVNNEDDSDLAWNIYDGEDDDTYNYYSDYYYVGSQGNVKMLYVITYAVEKEAQNNDAQQ